MANDTYVAMTNDTNTVMTNNTNAVLSNGMYLVCRTLHTEQTTHTLF